jgi:prepilin-type N-terminal cleavage/methylation domain-containing protein
MRYKKNPGFTLIEFIAVLIILGIVAAVAISKYSDQNAPNRVDTDVIKDVIRKTQMRAMADLSNANWNISASGTTVSIYKDTTLSSTTSLNNTLASPFTIYFNNLGGVSSSTGSLPYSITIDTETGFVQ